MLKLILGRGGSGKTSRIFKSIGERVDKTQGGNILIVPEQYSHAAERELCAVCGDKASVYAEVLSFTRLADRVFSEIGGLAEPALDGAGRILCMDMAVKAVEDKLCVYRTAAGKPEYLEGLLDSIDELKSCDISGEKLEDAASEVSTALGRKILDLSLILSAYDAITGRRDPRDRLTKLAETINESTFIKGSSFYIDGFTDFTAQEMQVVREIMKIADSVTVALTTPGLTGEDEIFESSRKTAAALYNIAGKIRLERVVDSENSIDTNKCEEIKFIEKHIFGAGIEKFEAHCQNVEIINAPTPAHECEIAAAKIRQLVLEENCKYSDIVVVARDFHSYETMAERIFARYNVPTYVAEKSDIMQKPVLMLLTSALDAVTNGWRYESMMRYLKTGLSGLSPEESDKLENYVYMWNIKGSLWEKDNDWSFSPDGYGSVGDKKQELEEINKLRRKASRPLIRLRNKGKKAKTLKEQVIALYEFFEEIGLAIRLQNKAEQFEADGERQLAGEYVQLWSIIVDAMEQCVASEGEMQITQKDFAGIFSLTLSQYSVATIPMSLDRVGMGEMDRMRHRNVKYIIVLGAHDESLPAVSKASGMLTDSERDTLIEIGLPLSNSSSERLERELGLIYNVLTMASEGVIVLWPSVGGDGKEKRASTVAVRLRDMFSLESTANDDYRTWARKPCLDLILSKDEEVIKDFTEASKMALNSEDRDTLKSLEIRSRDREDKISDEVAEILYGEKQILSASRLETYGLCHYSYFMQYGLKAKITEKAEFDAPAAGSFVHFILENVVRDIGTGSGFKEVKQDEIKVLTDKYVDMYIREELLDFKDKTERFIYLFNRLRRETYEIVKDMIEELKGGEFKPLDFELKFAEDGQIKPALFSDGELEIALTGIIDRVDGWVHGDVLYLRVMDYKTGIKDFSLSDIWYGVGMQMLLYLFALCEDGCEYYKNSLKPAGVLYAPAREVFLSKDRESSDEDIRKERDKKLKRRGIILDDAEIVEAMEEGDHKRFIPVKVKKGTIAGDSLLNLSQLDKLSRHIKKLVIEIAGQMRSGDISVNPASGSVRNPCEYCGFRSACQLEENSTQVRYMRKLANKQVFKLINEELGKGDESVAEAEAEDNKNG